MTQYLPHPITGRPIRRTPTNASTGESLRMTATIAHIIANPPSRSNMGYTRDDIAPFEQMALCGGCHQWGCDPEMGDTRNCETCGRTEDDIRERHGVCWLCELLEPDIEL